MNALTDEKNQEESPTSRVEAHGPICVDLDGTLISTDLLWEGVFALLRTRPRDVLLIPGWLVKGRANLKGKIADRVVLDAATLPYRPEVLEFLEEQRATGRRLVLATASEERFARSIAEHLGIFDELIATSGETNLKGVAKREALQARFGGSGFDYVGDSRADIPVWSQARRAYLVGASPRLLRQASGVCTPNELRGPRRRPVSDVFRAMRLHQWAKNLLLFVPLVLGHQVGNVAKIVDFLIAFVAFSLAASSVYVLNDLLDLPSDRRHATKSSRPFAAGRLSIPVGMLMAVTLVLSSLLISLALRPAFLGMLLIYLATTTAYSCYLKRKLMIDVLCLAGLYTLRILAGGVATSVVVSHWLLAFSMFFFLSLAFAKRYTELDASRGAEQERLSGRGYMPIDLELVRTVGPASGYLSVLVLCLYLQSVDVTKIYARPDVLWLLCPILLYWITRVWFLAQRKQLHEDPVLFAIRDKNSLVCGLVSLCVLIGASL